MSSTSGARVHVGRSGVTTDVLIVIGALFVLGAFRC